MKLPIRLVVSAFASGLTIALAASWKGRGLWVSEGDRAPWLMEGGTENRPLVVHFQVRPDPLAK